MFTLSISVVILSVSEGSKTRFFTSVQNDTMGLRWLSTLQKNYIITESRF